MSEAWQNEPARRRGSLLDVAVVGGGMVGAATALALARSGFSVALIDAREPAAWAAVDEVDLRVVGLAPSSVALLDQLGVWPQIREARASAYERMHVWDAENGAAIHFDAADQGRDVLGYIVENSLVQATLWQALDAAGVRRIVPAEVIAYTMRDDRAQLDLADGQVVTSRLVVAADGAESPLRTMVGIGTHGRDYAQRAVVAHVETTEAHQRTAWQRFLPSGPLAFLPLADGRSSIVWSLPDAEAKRVLALDDEAFRQALGVASDFRLGPIRAVTRRAAFPLRLKLAGRYEVGRVVLLGDAAHAVHPLAGQGVNLGLRDVAELRDTLVEAREAGRDFAATHVLRRYARRRRSADGLDAWSFDALARIYAWQAPPLVTARGLGVRLLGRIGPLKSRLARHAAGL
ncbi:2-octaprenyl-6-methoxyphenol hydroxylase /2-octaprenyl-3-methyl-6-methoxy-1,4-benzoquinol hydroxylase [Luteibacter sp. OK325]|uniref:UbiH/UbiF/VisC/COQ6 family ubiquinone biosynthesis hydroxylase n=1 Tax=Luteibacter sp. OK325 TaxID=2135670 RepID=UPI000D35E3E8|nr:UbiH/UbiF/VisC/COQ6 family ubiquinone biosynthesis hydroxylase [Luteibacter sp. OK325]PTR34847.1 2-octaprenyl-6-methoxyphenol hydroxylase /2-octaprenyl-3-methyl-6-methoxy-1,4-benzoquinol hydroxylase [Luteibacter sp. OK325]